MCVQLRPVIKDDSMFTSSVQRMSEVYKYTKVVSEVWDCYKFTTNCVNMLSDYQLELAVNRTG